MVCANSPDPPKAGRPEEEYYQRVAKVHESGGYGSIGYRAPFSRDDSERLLLRTHTTAVSTNMLYQIANQPGGFKPAKLFSIDRVFRSVHLSLYASLCLSLHLPYLYPQIPVQSLRPESMTDERKPRRDIHWYWVLTSQKRSHGRHPSGRILPGGRCRRGLRHHTGEPHW